MAVSRSVPTTQYSNRPDDPQLITAALSFRSIALAVYCVIYEATKTFYLIDRMDVEQRDCLLFRNGRNRICMSQ